MKAIAVIVMSYLAAGCGVDRSCDQACAALRSVRPDREGYLPRDAVFKAVGITENDLIPFVTTRDGGHARIACGAHFEYIAKGANRRMPTQKTIDEILNNPNRAKAIIPDQLDSVVVIQDNREIYRFDSRARSQRLAAYMKKEAQQAASSNR
jgi:hypothetical protein